MAIKILAAGEQVAVPAPQAVPQATPAPAAAAPTPSETIIRSAPGRKTAVVTVGSGRQITVRRLSALDRRRAAKAIGSELVTNALYANYALLACSITGIDGDPIYMPASQQQIEAVITRVGDDFDELTEEMRRAFADLEPDAFDPATAKN